MTQNEFVIFLHIPKAAGSSLRRIIESQFNKNEIFELDLAPGQDFDLVKRLKAEQLDKIKIFQGHMHFGLHKELHSPFTYITILREPVDRIVSHYYYVLRNKNHYLYNEVTSKKMTIADYVRNKTTTELDNGQVRLISGINTAAFGGCTHEMLELAKYNLKHFFSVVGVSERFDEVVSLLKRRLNWRVDNYSKENITEGRPKTCDLSADVIDLIVENNKFDIDLYNYSIELLEDNLSYSSPIC